MQNHTDSITVAITLAQGRIAHELGFETPTKRSLIVEPGDIDGAMDAVTDHLSKVSGSTKLAVTGLYERLMAVRDADAPKAEIEAGEPAVEEVAPVEVPAPVVDTDTNLVFEVVLAEAEAEPGKRPIRLEAVGRRAAGFGAWQPAVDWASELVQNGETTEATVIDRATGKGVRITKAA